MSSVTLEWKKSSENRWPDLSAMNLDDPQFQEAKGVYIIFHGGQEPGIVCVGQGNIREKLKNEAHDSQVQAFSKHRLFVAWANAAALESPGIEKFLSEKLTPKVSRDVQQSDSITVNLPWVKKS